MKKDYFQIIETKIHLYELIDNLSKKNRELENEFNNATLEIEKGKEWELNSMKKIKITLADICCILKKIECNTDVENESAKVDFELNNEYKNCYKDARIYRHEIMEAENLYKKLKKKNTESLKILSNKKDNNGKIPVFLKLIKELEEVGVYSYFGYFRRQPQNSVKSKYDDTTMAIIERDVVKKYMKKLSTDLELYINITRKNLWYKISYVVMQIRYILKK